MKDSKGLTLKMLAVPMKNNSCLSDDKLNSAYLCYSVLLLVINT